MFLIDGLFTDFSITCSDGKEFKVHRNYLADASKFFLTMFTTDMEEKQKGVVVFEDIDSETLQVVLKYIYKDGINSDELGDIEKASKVLYAAEKLDIPGLKSNCCDVLEKQLCDENVIEIFLAADMYNVKDLEEICLKRIIDNYSEIKKTAGWQLLTRSMLEKICDALKYPYPIVYSSL